MWKLYIEFNEVGKSEFMRRLLINIPIYIYIYGHIYRWGIVREVRKLKCGEVCPAALRRNTIAGIGVSHIYICTLYMYII